MWCVRACCIYIAVSASALCIFVFSTAVRAQSDPPAPTPVADPAEQVVIHKIVVNRSNIFEAGQNAAGQPVQVVMQGINRFHKTTHEAVILREIGVSPGDSVTALEVKDIERRLRGLGIFASVNTGLVTGAEGVELRIDTRDNFSIVAGASGSYLGGVGDVGFKVGDKNIFGSGNKLVFSLSRNTTDNFRGSLQFDDLHFFDRTWRAEYRLGRTDEGDFYGFTVRNPFKSLTASRAWSVSVDGRESAIKYYEDGQTVVQLPEDRKTVSGRYIWRTGDTNHYLRRGFVAQYNDRRYEAVTGVSAATIEVPEDNQSLYFGGLVARDALSYTKVQGLDTLNFVQDLALGSSAELQLGLNHIEETETGVSRQEPGMSLLLNRALLAGDNTYLKFSLAANTVFEEEGDKPWTAATTFKAYYTGIEKNTFALRVDYTTGEDGSGLPVQNTLGENNGLRGYDTRQFAGRQRARINLESRYSPGWKLGVVDIGMVGFIDAGWATARNESSISANRAIGAGLRFGSTALLGSTVIRLDVAVPLDPPVGDSEEPSVSFAVGQVFRF